MRKYAVLENNQVIELVDLDESTYPAKSARHQAVIDIEDMSPRPSVGWILSGNSLVPYDGQTLSLEESLRERVRAARLFGAQLVANVVDRVGAKNLMMGKTEQQILTVVVALDPIKKLLEGGALITARTQILAIQSSFPEFSSEFDYAIQQLNGFLGIQ